MWMLKYWKKSKKKGFFQLFFFWQPKKKQKEQLFLHLYLIFMLSQLKSAELRNIAHYLPTFFCTPNVFMWRREEGLTGVTRIFRVSELDGFLTIRVAQGFSLSVYSYTQTCLYLHMFTAFTHVENIDMKYRYNTYR